MTEPNLVYVKPIEGATVRWPGTMSIMSADGGWVPWLGAEGTEWRRRVNDGSVVVTDAPGAVKEVQAEQSTSAEDENQSPQDSGRRGGRAK